MIVSIARLVLFCGWAALAFIAASIGPNGAALGQSTEVPASGSRPLIGTQLLKALQVGGYVLYFRHTSTDFGQNDEKMTGYEDCARQRNLTEVGRAEARAIGVALRALDIPIGDVLASPFCRTRETGELIFGRAKATPAVRGGPAQAEAERYAELRTLLANEVPRGTNVAITSHGNPFHAVAGGPYLAEGEAAVIEPRGNEGFVVVARVRKDEWMGLSGAK